MTEIRNEEQWWFPRLNPEVNNEESDHWNQKYECLWDHVGDAYEQYEPLADAYMALRAQLAEAKEALKIARYTIINHHSVRAMEKLEWGKPCPVCTKEGERGLNAIASVLARHKAKEGGAE